MNEERKNRIAEFVESLDEGDISSSTFLLGGTGDDSEGEYASYNGSDCKNDKYDSCNKATNRANCINATGMCSSSKNYGACDNTYRPQPDNLGNCLCT